MIWSEQKLCFQRSRWSCGCTKLSWLIFIVLSLPLHYTFISLNTFNICTLCSLCDDNPNNCMFIDSKANLLLLLTSVQFNCSVASNSLWPHESQQARPPCPSPTPGVYSNPCPSSRRCHPAISSSVVPFSSCPQSLPTSGSFPISQLFASGGQSIGVSASASVPPKNTQDWFPLGWTGWISLQSKGLSRVFSNTTVQKHQFFST